MHLGYTEKPATAPVFLCLLFAAVTMQLLSYKVSVTLLSSLQIQRTGLVARQAKGAQAPHNDCRRFFCVRISVLWWLCAGGPRACRVPFAPVDQPAYSCHPYLFGRKRW